MYEIFGDAPAIQWIKDSAREEERKRIEAEREAERKQIEAERKRIEAEREAERKRIEAERKHDEKQWKDAALKIITMHFPKLKRLAKTQIATITDRDELQQLVIRLSLIHAISDMEELLLSLHAQDEDENV